MGAHMSGAYFNPALVIGAVAAQKMTPQKAGGYIVAQLVGAFAAGGMGVAGMQRPSWHSEPNTVLNGTLRWFAQEL
jgi:glycerol uptake facilitator-like aquaporin